MKQTAESNSVVLDFPVASYSCLSLSLEQEQKVCVIDVKKKTKQKEIVLASLLQFLHVSLTAVYQTGVSSSDPRQSHRVYPVHEAKKPHTPAGHRRLEEAERTAGAARYRRLSLYHKHKHFTFKSICA